VLLLSLVALSLRAPQGVHSAKVVMPWACMELCGGNITGSLLELKTNSPVGSGIINAVSFELYNLSNDSSVVMWNVTDISSQAIDWSLKVYPMITSVDIYHMRQLFQAPQPLIDYCIQAGIQGTLLFLKSD